MRGKASIVVAVGCCKFLLATRSEVNILILAGVHPSPLPPPPKKKKMMIIGEGDKVGSLK